MAGEVPTTQQIALFSIAIALGALLVSSVSLWRSHFAKLRTIVVSGPLRLRIYPIKSDGRSWFLTSFDLPVSFLNPGAQPILITGVQLRLHFPKIPIPGNAELVPAKWEIGLSDAQRIGKDRFTWIREIAPADFMSFAVLPTQTVVKHLILETRWEEPVISDEVQVTLEWRASSKADWSKAVKWIINLDKFHWSELANVGTSISYPVRSGAPDEQLVPKDLHKYTGTKDPIPEKGFDAAPSHLDYPTDNRS